MSQKYSNVVSLRLDDESILKLNELMKSFPYLHTRGDAFRFLLSSFDYLEEQKQKFNFIEKEQRIFEIETRMMFQQISPTSYHELEECRARAEEEYQKSLARKIVKHRNYHK